MTDNFERERAVAWLHNDVFRLSQKRWNRVLKDSGAGLTAAQSRILTILERSAGLTQTELAEEAEMEKAPLGRLLDRMEEIGLIERRADPEDRRVRRVYQSAGVDKLEVPVWLAARRMLEISLADFSEEDITAMINLLRRMKKNLLHADMTDQMSRQAAQGEREPLDLPERQGDATAQRP